MAHHYLYMRCAILASLCTRRRSDLIAGVSVGLEGLGDDRLDRNIDLMREVIEEMVDVDFIDEAEGAFSERELVLVRADIVSVVIRIIGVDVN